MEKPSIEELERLLNSESPGKVQILPDGSIEVRDATQTTVGAVADLIMKLVEAEYRTPDREAHGNGAREAVISYFDKFWLGRESHQGQILSAPDWFLSWLWQEGFKIVPAKTPSSLRVIRTPADHQIALARISELMDAKADTEEGRELDVLVELVSHYETDDREAPAGDEAMRLALEHWLGCYDAACVEGLIEVMAECKDDRLMDLLRRRAFYQPAIEQARDALASRGKPPDGWRPISEAPKDAKPIQGYCPTEWQDCMPIIYWDQEHWWLAYTGLTNKRIQCDGATHWQPLPAPPRLNQAGEGGERG